jgi:hypothetical protein
MRRYRLRTKREAINFALGSLAAKPLPLDQARRLRAGRDAQRLPLVRPKAALRSVQQRRRALTPMFRLQHGP